MLALFLRKIRDKKSPKVSKILLILLILSSILSSGCFLPAWLCLLCLYPFTSCAPGPLLMLPFPAARFTSCMSSFCSYSLFSNMLKRSFPVLTSYQNCSLINPAGCRTSLLKCLAVTIKCLKPHSASSLTNHCFPL